ncbi:DUF5320 domain-containing protein [Candidatus Sumerlaeota bacterium]
MPGGDNTGPTGQGPMTGRAAGFCAGYSVPGFQNPVMGRGGFAGRDRGFHAGRGGGGRRGWRNQFYATGLTGWQRAAPGGPVVAPEAFAPSAPAVTKEQELNMLKSQAEHFEGMLAGIKSRLEELEAQAEE